MSTRVHISLPVEVLAAVEKVRGDVPRAVWIRRAVEEKLGVGVLERAEGVRLSRPVAPRIERPVASSISPTSRQESAAMRRQREMNKAKGL